jgi:RND family efflux transporter MFP subunit
MSLLKQVFLCVVLVAAAIGGWYAYRHPGLIGEARKVSAAENRQGDNGGNRIPGLMRQNGAVNVITAPVEIDQSGETVVALGTSKAARSVTIYPQVTGIVSEIMFTPGDAVADAAPLIQLEDDEQQVAVDRARAELQMAEEALERARTLAQSKTVSDAALLERETAATVAEVELRAAEIALSRRRLAAPFAGITGLTDISIGDLVTSSTAITTLDDLSTVRVGFEVPERWAGRISLGHPINATAQAVAGTEFAGRISAIDNRVDETTRTLKMEAELANEGDALRAGMAIKVSLHFETDEELSVPSLAVQWDRRGSFVWKVVEGAARRADVSILRRQSGVVTVTGDIAAGDPVVVEGVQRLREGAKVVEVDATPALVEGEGQLPAKNADPEAPAVSRPGAPLGLRS